jgi:hypothetical protein
MADLYTVMLFARRRAFAAIRSADRDAVIEAFNALAAIDVKRVDPDDVAMEALLATYAAPGAGITARAASSHAVRHASSDVAEILAEIAEDDGIGLADALGRRVVATPDGPVVLGDESEPYEPERDLAAVMLAAATAIEADGTYHVEDVGVADALRAIWVNSKGTDNPQVAAALNSVTGCASLHGRPVEHREGGHSLMGWLAETGTDEAAAVLAAGANCAGSAHTAISGIRSGRLVLVLAAGPMDADRPSFETTESMTRFQHLQNLL